MSMPVATGSKTPASETILRVPPYSGLRGAAPVVSGLADGGVVPEEVGAVVVADGEHAERRRAIVTTPMRVGQGLFCFIGFPSWVGPTLSLKEAGLRVL
jgi:hypothetical protein